jgi:predicted Zn-ribbon and HTH transcriptional regulator
MARRPDTQPDARPVTVRQALHDELLAGPATARDLSRRVGIPEHDVPEHLIHLERSVRRSGQRLLVEPSVCLACGFAFTHRGPHRYTRPGRCPECHGRRITLPVFRIEPGGRGR